MDVDHNDGIIHAEVGRSPSRAGPLQHDYG
jgi:hypothetical protein